MGPSNWVSTILRCARHGKETGAFCLYVPQEVQGQLRCTPPGGGGGGGSNNVVACPCGTGLTVPDLQRRVMDALRRGGIGQWIKRGAVVIDC